MSQGPPDDPDIPPSSRRGRAGRAEFKAQVKSTRADIERQVQATRADIERQMQARKAKLDATNERIEARTGRNLILAILIGLGFGLLMLFSLIVIKELFMVVAAASISFAAFELTQALRASGRLVPRIPTVIGAIAVIPAAYFWHSAGQLIAVGGGILLVWAWRLVSALVPAHRVPASQVWRELGAGAFIQVYVAFLGSFSVLLLAETGGQWWTLAFLIAVIAVDTGAYVSGLLFGRHPMAPTISPKKTWEGLAGAAVASMIAGILLASLMLGEPWWFGFPFGLVLLFSATIGDLAESLVKRDLGIKDMSSWLPGHGGFLDRLDSILPSAAAAYALFLIFR
ncbi:MAG: phosphatidate cytidylyltransferase [Microbacteriaceae bacterium]|nr:phosphatidate cytidylyltransferase [Microbacteriaceae bacterium]